VSWELANQQVIQENLGIVNSFDICRANSLEKPRDSKITKYRSSCDPEADLYGESTELVSIRNGPAEIQTPKTELSRHGKTASFIPNGALELFGSASYASKRITGEVNIAITTESEAALLFAEHAPAEKKEAPQAACYADAD
jgi:hypothetical protein